MSYGVLNMKSRPKSRPVKKGLNPSGCHVSLFMLIGIQFAMAINSIRIKNKMEKVA